PHTRSTRDWSSDVCSSDLTSAKLLMVGPAGNQGVAVQIPASEPFSLRVHTKSKYVGNRQNRPGPPHCLFRVLRRPHGTGFAPARSEERRVGNACSSLLPAL